MLLKMLLFLVLLLDVYGEDILFTSGWYKTKRKCVKKTVNNVSSIGPDVFPNSASYLKIGGVIPVLRKGSVHNLGNLKELTISSSGIIEIHPGTFQDLPLLTKLNLKENGIRHIKKGIFNRLNVTGLFLNKNEISIIDSDAFDDMPYLIKIKLNSNQISTWDVNWFKRTPSLRVVLMRRNSMREIPEYALQNLIKSDLTDRSKVPDLKLYLSKNKIAEIHPRAFVGVKKLGHLFLDRNKLTELNTGIFQGIEQIHVLSIAKNNLTMIPKELFLTVKSIRELDLSANHRLHCLPDEVGSLVQILVLENVNNFNCTCIQKLRTHSKVVGSEINCAK